MKKTSIPAKKRRPRKNWKWFSEELLTQRHVFRVGNMSAIDLWMLRSWGIHFRRDQRFGLHYLLCVGSWLQPPPSRIKFAQENGFCYLCGRPWTDFPAACECGRNPIHILDIRKPPPWTVQPIRLLAIPEHPEDWGFRRKVGQWFEWEREKERNLLRAERIREARTIKPGWKKSDLHLLQEWQDSSCYYCGTGFTDQEPYQIEHLTPIAHDGLDDIENIRLACKACNYRKGTKKEKAYWSMLERKNVIAKEILAAQQEKARNLRLRVRQHARSTKRVKRK